MTDVRDAPSRQAWLLAEDLLAVELPRRWAHSRGVGLRAGKVAKATALSADDADLLARAAVLHDIGYSSKAVETGFHALDGARRLKALGFEGRVVSLVAHHSCAAIEAEERGLAKALAEFPTGPPFLVDALIFCDMTISPDGHAVTIDERLNEILVRYGRDSLVGRCIVRAQPELWGAVKRVADRFGRLIA